jgi:hypothetical protein
MMPAHFMKEVAMSPRRKPKAVEDDAQAQVMARPDGYYWRAPSSRQEFGPFKTVELALADMQAADGQAPEPGETLQEAESELGIADWIDPDTGELAEGLSPPHLDDE